MDFEIYTSGVIHYGAFSVIVAGYPGSYRYMILSPDDRAILGGNFSKIIDAHRAAMRELYTLKNQQKLP